MRFGFAAAAVALALAVTACAPEREEPGADLPEPAAANGAGNATGTAAAGPTLPACPFRRTSEWVGSVEGGRMLVNGRVDVMMAGFRPELTARAGAPAGTLALDLALAPDPQAAVNDRVRYEASGSARRVEIWCGDERIARFDMIVVE